MKIAFDAKRFFHNTSGLGNYSRDLVRILAKYSPEDEFVLLAEKQSQRGKEILSLPTLPYQRECSQDSLKWVWMRRIREQIFSMDFRENFL